MSTVLHLGVTPIDRYPINYHFAHLTHKFVVQVPLDEGLSVESRSQKLSRLFEELYGLGFSVKKEDVVHFLTTSKLYLHIHAYNRNKDPSKKDRHTRKFRPNDHL